MTDSDESAGDVYGPKNVDRQGIELNWFVMTPFVRYEPDTGEILEQGQMSFSAIKHLEQENGWRYLREAGSSNTHYVDVSAATVREKTACPAMLDGLTLRSLPQPCSIEISNPIGAPTIYDMAAPEVALEFDHPGSYRVRILSVSHLPGAFAVIAP